MSATEIDLIRFTTGERKGELAIMEDHNLEFAVFTLAGEKLIGWDGNALCTDPSEWTPEMFEQERWLTTNRWEFVPIDDESLATLYAHAEVGALFGLRTVIGRYAPNRDSLAERARSLGYGL